MATLHKEIKHRGLKFAGFYALTSPSLMVTDPDLIKDMFIKNFSSFNERGFYYNEDTDPLSAHLVALRNPQWHLLRQKFSPTFTAAKLKMIHPLVVGCAEELASVVGQFAENSSPMDAKSVFSSYTIDVIGMVHYFDNFICKKIIFAA